MERRGQPGARRLLTAWLGITALVLAAACSAPAPSPTPTPSPTPPVAEWVELQYPDTTLPAGQMAIVDQSGLFHSAIYDASRPGPEGEDIWVLLVPGQYGGPMAYKSQV
jgi:hypothetical protein